MSVWCLTFQCAYFLDKLYPPNICLWKVLISIMTFILSSNKNESHDMVVFGYRYFPWHFKLNVMEYENYKDALLAACYSRQAKKRSGIYPSRWRYFRLIKVMTSLFFSKLRSVTSNNCLISWLCNVDGPMVRQSSLAKLPWNGKKRQTTVCWQKEKELQATGVRKWSFHGNFVGP